MLDSFFDVFFTVELDFPHGGLHGHGFGAAHWTEPPLTPTPEVFPFNGTITGTLAPASGGIAIEITSMSLIGFGPTHSIMIRESPTLQSITVIPGGPSIPSFFDVFFEMSLDQGNSWIPNVNPLRLNGVPETSSVAGLLVLALGLLGLFHRKTTE